MKCIAIAGPTASGKTATAIALASQLGAEIVNIDSVQVYRGCAVGSAAPTEIEQAQVRHHLVGVRDPRQPLDAAGFAALAREAIAGIHARGVPVVLVAGTGLWYRATVRGLDDMPSSSPALRAELLTLWRRDGGSTLRNELRLCDPDSFARLAPADQARNVRALEVFRLARRPISSFWGEGRSPAIEVLGYALDPPREALYRRAEARLDAMVHNGLIEETQALLAMGCKRGELPLKALGYAHVSACLQGECDLPAAIGLAKRDTRRFAKRQWTWFRKEPGFTWVAPPYPTDAWAEQARAFLDADPERQTPTAEETA